MRPRGSRRLIIRVRMRRHKVLGTNTPGVLDDTVADLVMGLILASARRITELDQYVKQGRWTQAIPEPLFGRDVHHATLGIIGLGRIGEAVARRARFGFDMKREAQLVGYVKAGDFPKAKSLLDEILRVSFGDAVPSPQLLRFRLYSLIGNILRAVNGVDVPDIRKLVEKVEADGALYSCENIAQFQTELNSLFDELERICRQAESSLKDGFKDEVISIVNDNYSNTELNVGFIADMMGRNLDSLSRTFTKLTGMGLLDYIHSVRIEKSKALLSGGEDLTIQRIASMTTLRSPSSGRISTGRFPAFVFWTTMPLDLPRSFAKT